MLLVWRIYKRESTLENKSESGGICKECYEKVRGEMKIQRAIQIAGREWENIRLSLEMCGDIGEFDPKDFVNNGSDWLSLVRNIKEMEYKYPIYGYFSHQAAYVFNTLALKAGERLGLIDKFATTFGGGYSCVRTGWFFHLNGDIEKHHILKQMFFLKLFSPLGGDFMGWDYKSPIAGTKMKLIFDTFTKWQDNPDSYIQDIREYKTQLEPLWHGLLLSLNPDNLKHLLFKQWH